MVREAIVEFNARVKDILEGDEEMIVAIADLPDDKVWLVIVTPPEEADEVKVMG